VTTLVFRDLAPFEGELDQADDAWLSAVAEVDPRQYRIGLDADSTAVSDDWLPLIERGPDGRWWGGRYIGFLRLHGRRLVIEPRLGLDIVEEWLDQAFGLAAPPASAKHASSEAFIVRLLARLWCRSLDAATRHGLPLLRLPRSHSGLYVRGRIDIPETLRHLAQGRASVASTTYDRSLAHPATRAIVCADRVLAERLATRAEWRTARVREVMPHLRGAVGSRPRLPSPAEVEQVRFTPITMRFKQAAVLSQRIASHLGYSAREGADAEGLLIDVAELWELFVLNCIRQATPAAVRVEHGTTAKGTDYLLNSANGDAGMGRLKPDVVVSDGRGVVAVIDAKYKRLVDSRERPRGVDRSDLYQLATYASRFRPSRFAALLYPETDELTSTAERLGPWRNDDQTFLFRRMPTNSAACRAALAEMFEDPPAS